MADIDYLGYHFFSLFTVWSNAKDRQNKTYESTNLQLKL